MPHDHHHHHHGHHHPAPAGDGAIIAAVAINLVLTLAQITGGVLGDSMALIADGVHNLSDAAALVLAFVARRLAQRPATADYSFGWGRAEIVAAFVNYTMLMGISVWLIVESLMRLANPPEVSGLLVMALSGLALVIDIATAALVYRSARESSNMRAAFLHNLADAGVSVAVLIGGAMIWAWGWGRADPVITIGISVVIIWHVAMEFGPVWRAMMLAAPPGSDPARVLADLGALDGVARAHHLHLWQIDERRRAVSVHLVVDAPDRAPVIAAARAMLAERHDIAHCTIETERP